MSRHKYRATANAFRDFLHWFRAWPHNVSGKAWNVLHKISIFNVISYNKQNSINLMILIYFLTYPFIIIVLLIPYCFIHRKASYSILGIRFCAHANSRIPSGGWKNKKKQTMRFGLRPVLLLFSRTELVLIYWYTRHNRIISINEVSSYINIHITQFVDTLIWFSINGVVDW